MMRLFSGRRLRLGDDGSQLIEVAVGAFVLAVAVLGVVGSMGSGLGLVGDSRQRSAAVAVAQERLERARNVPYTRVALYEQPTHSNVAGNPDADVVCTGSCTPATSRYRITTEGTTVEEDLVVDTASGALKHLDDPVTLGNTEFNIYQYVTWHNDPTIGGSQDYKRVIVIVTWKFPVASGPENRVVQSTFIGNGAVVVPLSTATPSPAPTAPPTSTPAGASGNCGLIEVLSGAGAAQGYTNSTTVQVRLSRTPSCSSSSPTSVKMKNATDAAYPQDPVVSGTPALQTPMTLTWTIPAGDGPKIIQALFLEGGSGPGERTATVILDQTKPTTPSLTKGSCTVSGNSRTVGFTWQPPSPLDPSLVGYRVYKSVNNGAFSAMSAQPTDRSFSDTDSKGYDSLRYLVRAYDKAGNENALGPPITTGDSNVLSYSKVNGNTCS